MEARTHLAIDPLWCGTPVAIAAGSAEVELETVPAMAADERGLVHGGFVFGLADYAAMLAVNEPLVVLAEAAVDFLRPVRVGDRLRASAVLASGEGKAREVACTVRVGEREVMRGRFLCAVPSRHVLDPREPREPAAAAHQEGGAA